MKLDFTTLLKLILSKIIYLSYNTEKYPSANPRLRRLEGTLKNELVHLRRYETRQEAIREITEYIEIFYNRQRHQKRLGYLSPAAYERRYSEKQFAA